MRRGMPTSLIVAETAIALFVVYMAIIFGLHIRYLLLEKSGLLYTVVPMLHLAWGITALVGIPFRRIVAWRIACIASAIFGLLVLCQA